MNAQTKNLMFTWSTNVRQKKLPSVEKLQNYLNSVSSYSVFHSKVLEGFKEVFKNVEGLTLLPVHDKVASKKKRDSFRGSLVLWRKC
jgi:hypothetical protein